MKIGILTFHRADNYGAVLQTYALYSQCRAMGYNTEIIDYRCSAIENSYLPIKFPKLRKNMYRWSVDIVNYLRFRYNWNEKAKKFSAFRKLFPMSPSYYDLSSKNNIETKYDCIITGSDQIWSIDILGEANYWYCYKKETFSNVSVVSYAASVGSLPHFQERFCDFESVLSEYDALSVRETGVRAFLEEKLNRKIYTVLDPTLLVDRQLWLDLISKENNRDDRYLVYYDVAQNKLSRQIARDIARQRKYTVIKFNQIKSPVFNTKYLSDAGPIDFLNNIYGAECVVTSSFHATVFSILFQKNFVAVLHPITGERIKSFLSVLGLENRIIYENKRNVVEIMNQPIDYASVELKLSMLRVSSINFLRNALSLGKE